MTDPKALAEKIALLLNQDPKDSWVKRNMDAVESELREVLEEAMLNGGHMQEVSDEKSEIVRTPNEVATEILKAEVNLMGPWSQVIERIIEKYVQERIAESHAGREIIKPQ